MNIIDAIKSGKRFRLALSDDDWMHIDNNGYISVGSFDCPRIHHLYIAKVILAKYEVEEKSVTITESQLDKAVMKFYMNRDGSHLFHDAVALVKKELGF